MAHDEQSEGGACCEKMQTPSNGTVSHTNALQNWHYFIVHFSPQAMCMQLRDALRVGCIGLSDRFFCNSMPAKEMLKIMDDELKNFCVLVEAPKTPFGNSRKTYSGKVGGRNDDGNVIAAKPTAQVLLSA